MIKTFPEWIHTIPPSLYEKPGFFISAPSRLGASWYILLNPVLLSLSHRGKVTVITSEGEKESSVLWEDGFRSLLGNIPLNADPKVPWAAGYLAYELLHHFEAVTITSTDIFKIPDSFFACYSLVIELSEDSSVPKIHRNSFASGLSPIWEVEPEILFAPLPGGTPTEPSNTHPEEEFSADQGRYTQLVETVKKEILCGEVYQVNLSRQARRPPLPHALHFFETLMRNTPASEGAFFSALRIDRSPFSVSSASPELFFKSESAVHHNKIFCSPIKGTRSRGKTPLEDNALKEELLDSEKDHSELAMIVDLVRNDLSRISVPGTVNVVSHARLETLSYVHHLVSDIEARIDPSKDLADVIPALFPSGSITGAPKIAAMEQIAQLEDSTRGVYTGSIGIIFPTSSRWSVAIRTAHHLPGAFVSQNGGGITIDSDARQEFLETEHKGRAINDSYEACRYPEKQ